MTRLSRRTGRLVLAVVALLGAVLAGSVSVVLGLDAVAVAVGGAVIAVAFAVTVGVWLESLLRTLRAARRRERRRVRRERRRAARIRRAIRAAERRLFGQIEALLWLRDTLELEAPLPRTRGLEASPETLLELVRIIDRIRPEHILALGSGVSTIVISARLKAIGSGRLVALEHDAEAADATRDRLREQGLEAVVRVVHAPLAERAIGDDVWRWYAAPADAVPETLDLLFVDGPPGDTGPLARYPALPLLAERLTPGASILLDDTKRPDEREIVRRWRADIDGLTAEELPIANGAALMRMPG